MKTVTRLNPLRSLIQRATDAPARDLALVENIMRDDIFHSTLDWQTNEQLSSAARQAFDLLNENRDLYEFNRASALDAFKKCAQHSLRANHKIHHANSGSPKNTRKKIGIQ